MPNLLVDIYFLEKLAVTVDQVVARLEESHRASQSTFILAEADWQGHSRQRFEREDVMVRDQSNLAVQQGQEVSWRIRQAIARFEQIEGDTSTYSG